MNRDSTGQLIQVGVLVEWRGRIYTIASFGRFGAKSVEFDEPQDDPNSIPLESAVTRIRFTPTENTFKWNVIEGFVVATTRLPDMKYETKIKDRDDRWGWGDLMIQTDTEAEACTAHSKACTFVRSRINQGKGERKDNG